LIATALVIVTGFTPVMAATKAPTYDTPKALMEAVYAPYMKKDFNWDSVNEDWYRSKALNALFAKDLKEANGEVGRIDFDPYFDGQDFEITDLKIGDATITGDKASIEVKFKNFDMEEDMVFALVKEGNAWKIDDVNSKGGADPYDLHDIMTAPLVQ